MKGDLRVLGVSGGVHKFRVAASATRFYAGEPINSLSALTAGATSVNTVVVLTDGKPRIGTDNFVGIASRDAKVNASATVVAQVAEVITMIPSITRIRGKAKVAANVDTDAELLLILGDVVDFDLTAGVYTIDETAASNASGLRIEDGDTAKQTLDVSVDGRAMRKDVS